MPTDADVYLMKMVGYSVLSNMTSVIVSSLLYGTFIVIFFATMTTTTQRGLKSLPSIIIFSITIINFISLSILWALPLVLAFQGVKHDLLDQTPSTFNSKTTSEFGQVTWRYSTGMHTLNQLMLMLSDSVVIWRAWVIVTRKWIMVLPIILVVASTACGFAATIIEGSDFRWFIASYKINFSVTNLLLDASIALSFLANTLTTLSTVHVLWVHLRSRKKFGLQKKGSKVLKVLTIIIDTGLAFLLLQGLNMIFRFLHFERLTAYDFFQNVILTGYSSLTAMYPTIVIYLVNQQRSLDEVFALSDANGNETPEMPFDRTITIGPLAFASTEATRLSGSMEVDFKDTCKGSDMSPITKSQDMV